MKNQLTAVLFAALALPNPATQMTSKVMNFAQFSELNRVSIPTNDPNCDDTCQKRRTEFRYVVYVGQQIYCYWDLKKPETGTDFDALATRLENTITTTTSFSDYYLLLRQWASAFHDGHVNVMQKADLTGLDIYTAPIRVEVLAPATDHEKVIVSQINQQLNASNGVAVGDEIVAINGIPIHDALTQAAAEASSGSTERMRRYWAGRRLTDVIGAENGAQSFTLTVKPISGGPQVDVPLFRNVELDLPPSTAPTAEDTGTEYYSARVLPNGIGYFRLDAFEGTQDEALINAAMDRLSDTTGLILDLRHNGGGDLSGDSIIARLATQAVTRYKRSERLSDFILAQDPENFGLTPDASGKFAVWHDLVVPADTNHHYAKPVVALISPYCFSACDTFSAGLQMNHLATFIGEPTGGGTGTPLVFDLPISPLQFRYSVIRGEKLDMSLIEGFGTTPDIYMEPTAQDRATGKDSQLEKAIEVIQSHLGAQPGPALDLSSIQPTWLQDLDRSPTRAENDLIVSVSANDEK